MHMQVLQQLTKLDLTENNHLGDSDGSEASMR